MPLGSAPWSARLRYFWNLSRGFPDLTGSFSSRLGLSSVSSFLKIMFALTLLLGAPVAAARSVNPPLARLIQKTLRGSIVENPSDRTPAPDPQRITTGTWGGQHVRLEATEDGARLEFVRARHYRAANRVGQQRPLRSPGDAHSGTRGTSQVR